MLLTKNIIMQLLKNLKNIKSVLCHWLAKGGKKPDFIKSDIL